MTMSWMLSLALVMAFALAAALTSGLLVLVIVIAQFLITGIFDGAVWLWRRYKAARP